MRSTADRKSTRLNSSHTEIYTLSLHDALPICHLNVVTSDLAWPQMDITDRQRRINSNGMRQHAINSRSEEHTSELQSHRDLHSFPTRRSSDLPFERRYERLGMASDGHH